MEFRFDHRPYSGKTFRPKPEIHLDQESCLLVIATPWGPRQAGRRVIDRMLEYFLLASEDKEVTSPFERLSCLSDAANNLRTAALLANDLIHREDNRAEYRSGVELFAASFLGNELVWLQVGQPQVFLARAGRHLMPMGSTIDLACDMSEGDQEMLPALPNQLLGLDSTVNMTINSFRMQEGDRLILLSHSSVPESVYHLSTTGLTMDSLSLALAKANPDLAYWLGILELDRGGIAATGLDAPKLD